MARKKAEDKYRSIMDTAITTFALRGFWDTPTSLISKQAGIADGTLFTYFKTKDDLINEVYLEIKRELTTRIVDGLSSYDSAQGKLRHLWNGYIEWGVQQPQKFNVMHQLSTSYQFDEKTQILANSGYAEIERLGKAAIANGEIRDYPLDYIAALIDSLAIMTVQLIGKNPDQMAYYQGLGFEILWRGIKAS